MQNDIYGTKKNPKIFKKNLFMLVVTWKTKLKLAKNILFWQK